MTIIQGQVEAAVSAVRSSGQPIAQLLQLGELAVSQVLPRYGALAWSGLVFYGSNITAQALSVASTTFTGLGVANPANSGKNLVLLNVKIAAAAVGAVAVSTPRLGYAATVTLTQGSAGSGTGAPTILGTSGSSVAKVGASATLGAAPASIMPLINLQWITAGAGMWQLFANHDVDGAIICPPGQMLTIDALTAAWTCVSSMIWAELPI